MPKKHQSWIQQVADPRVVLFILGYIVFLGALMALGFSVGPQKIRSIMGLPYNGPTMTQDLPDMSMNVAGLAGGMGGIKISLSLEVAKGETEELQKYMPLIMDRIHQCINNATAEEIADTANFHLLREHILHEANKVSGPVEIVNVYVRKLLAIKPGKVVK